MGAAGASGEKTYIDNVFSTYVYKGNNGNHTITNGIDNTEGGLLWTKARTVGESHTLFDTVRASNKAIYTNLAERDETRNFNLNFLSSGFSWNTSDGMVNNASHTYAAWNFRKKEGFFDVVTYTGTGSARTIAHSLGCVPGMILIKKTSASDPWNVYHRSLDSSSPENYRIFLDETDARIAANTTIWNQTKPTSTHFSLGTNDQLNGNGATYVAYLFAGGASSAATARSVTFNQNYIKSGSTSDYTMGTGDFTVECWWKPNEISNQGICQISDGGNGLTTSNWENTIAIGHNGGNWVTYGGNGNADSADYPVRVGTWYHLAYVKTGGSHKLYVNGIPVITRTDSTNYYGTTVAIGGYYSTGYTNRGEISNFRITKGQALYTTSFKPSIEPLTTTSQGATSSNVKLLCCNDASVTGSTVTGATISVGSGSPAASTNSPFDDLEGFKFGEDGDQNLIKCGYYKTASNEDADVYLGWEPQWILAKRTDSSTGGDWLVYDSFRGLSNAQDIKANSGWSESLVPNSTGVESSNSRIGATSTGIYADQYGANRTFVYMAIRRPDGYVGKPVEVGTNAFNVVYGNSSSSIPNFPSNFPVGMGIYKEPTSSYSWYLHTRLVGPYNLKTDSTSAQAPSAPGDGDATFDANAGWGKFGYNTDKASWMWKRHAGFDVVTYEGTSNGTTKTVNHSLGRVPEMIWIKARNDVQNWLAYHKGLNGGTTPWNYYVLLNDTAAESAYSFISQPTMIDFAVTSGWQGNNKNYMAMLFASVDGISKVGYYAGSGSTQTITTGFQPRFLIVKVIDNQLPWYVLDTTRGWAAGNDSYLQLNENAAQVTNFDFGVPTATGFTMQGGAAANNELGLNYIYYAHA